MSDVAAPATLDEARAQADALDETPSPKMREPDAPDARPKRTRAPRKRAPRKPAADRKPRAPAASASLPALRVQLEQAITGIGLAVFIVNQRDGQLIMDGAKPQSLALESLAKENPAVRDALLKLMKTSVYAQLAMAFAPTVLGLAANHGMVPPIIGMLVGANPPAQKYEPDGPSTDPFAGVDLNDLARAMGGEGATFGRVVAADNAVA